jgi:hypothetical protein
MRRRGHKQREVIGMIRANLKAFLREKLKPFPDRINHINIKQTSQADSKPKQGMIKK